MSTPSPSREVSAAGLGSKLLHKERLYPVGIMWFYINALLLGVSVTFISATRAWAPGRVPGHRKVTRSRPASGLAFVGCGLLKKPRWNLRAREHRHLIFDTTGRRLDVPVVYPNQNGESCQLVSFLVLNLEVKLVDGTHPCCLNCCLLGT